MEQNASIKSPFQMRDWRIVHLYYGNPFFDLDPNSEVQWELEVSKSIEPSEDQQYYTGTLRVDFSASITEADRTMVLSGIMASLFTYDGVHNSDNDRIMDQMLRINGLTFCLGMLRNFISSQSDLLGIRKRLILCMTSGC